MKMFTRMVTIVAAATLLFGCSSGPSLEEKVDRRMEALTAQDKEDMCNGYALFGETFIEDMIYGLAAENDISNEEASLVIERINELCEGHEYELDW